jgi:hypothetical protein
LLGGPAALVVLCSGLVVASLPRGMFTVGIWCDLVARAAANYLR